MPKLTFTPHNCPSEIRYGPSVWKKPEALVTEEVIKEIIKEIEVIKYVDVPGPERIVEVPVHTTSVEQVIQEKIVEVPVEVTKVEYVDREVRVEVPTPYEVVKTVKKVPNWCWLSMGIQFALIVLLLIK